MKKLPKKHILVLTPGFAKNEADTSCIPPLQVFLNRLNQHQNYKVSIISIFYPHRNDYSNWKQIDHYSSFIAGVFSKVKSLGKANKWFKKIHAKTPVDIIHSFWLNDAALIGQYIAYKNKIPHIVTLMGQDALKKNKYLFLLKIFKMQMVTLSSFHQSTLFHSTSIQSTSIIPWGIEKQGEEIKNNPRDIDILGVGNLTRLKDFSSFIKTFSLVNNSKPNICAVIAGDGPLRDSLQKEIDNLGLTNHITLSGSMPRERIIELMLRSKIFLHTSSYESFGYVLLEALSCGSHVVSTNVGIASEILDIKIGDTPEMLADLLIDLLSKSNSSGSIIPITIEDTISQYDQLYTKMTIDH